MSCYICDGPTIHKIMGSCQGPFCEKCHKYAAVTSFIPEISLDPTRYAITLLNPDANNIEHIRTLSKIANVNFLASKEILKKKEIEIFNGQATDVKKISDQLDLVSISHKISPKFKY